MLSTVAVARGAVTPTPPKRRSPSRKVTELSPVDEATRCRIRRTLEGRMRDVCALAEAAADTAQGVAPETALLYLRWLARRCDEAIVASLRR